MEKQEGFYLVRDSVTNFQWALQSFAAIDTPTA